jgi:class 3 adenylate cyclase
MANFYYLSSTLNETLMVNLLNKFNFLMGKVSQLYNGTVSYCAEGELVINFAEEQSEDEQAFYAICAGQLMLQLLGDLADVGDERIPVKLKIAVHSGPLVSGLYSAITQDTTNLTGKTLDLTREICDECPDNCLLLSATTFDHAGAGTRVDAEEFTVLDDHGRELAIYLAQEPMSDYGLLLERQAIQLVTLYAE